MPILGLDQDKLKISYTYTLGLEDHLLPNLRSPCLRQTTDAFNNNVMRLKRMMLSPAFVGDLSGRMQRYTDIAEFEITGTVAKTRYPPDERGKEIFDRMKELLSLDTARINASIGDPAGLAQIVTDAVQIGGTAAVILASANPDSTEFQALFHSYITGMWTNFETLAGDLWEAAVNEKPNVLAQLNGRSSRLKKATQSFLESRPSSSGDKLSNKTVRLDFLQYFNWNLTNKMGTVHKSRFEFARLEGIREAYASAFSEGADEIDEILTDDAIDALSILRNVIVHKGGNADREYLNRRNRFTNLPVADEGSPSVLDGEITARMIGEVIYCSAQFIAAVDDWIAAHP